jgi:hypothetical protein
LDTLIDRVGSTHPADNADIYTVLTPWTATESLRRFAEANFIVFAKESEDPETQLEQVKLIISEDRPWEERNFQNWRRRKERYIKEALYKGIPSQAGEDPGELSVSAYWQEGRFYINDVQQLYSVTATPDGLRRVGAWAKSRNIH